MWCSSCRQDVPGIASLIDGAPGCPRCGTLLAVDAGSDLTKLAQAELNERALTTNVPPTDETPDFKPAVPPRAEPLRISSLRWEAANWELNEKLRHVERITATSRRYDAASAQPSGGRYHGEFRSEAGRAPRGEAEPPTFAPPPRSPYSTPHYAPSYPSPHSPAEPHGPQPVGPAIAPDAAPHEWNLRVSGPRPGEFAALLVSTVFLGIATTAFCCGGLLAVWGAVAERIALRQMSFPILMGGVLALVVGILPLVMLRMLREEERRRMEAAIERTTQSTRVRAPEYAQSGERRAA